MSDLVIHDDYADGNSCEEDEARSGLSTPHAQAIESTAEERATSASGPEAASPDASVLTTADDEDTIKLKRITVADAVERRVLEETRLAALRQPATSEREGQETGEEEEREEEARPLEEGAEEREEELVTAASRRSESAVTAPALPALIEEKRHLQTPRRRRRAAQSRPRRLVTLLLLATLALGILVPLVMGLAFGVQVYMTYSTLRSQASEGVAHLLNLTTIFNGIKAHPSGFLDVHKLQQAQEELQKSRQAFLNVRTTIDDSSTIHTIISIFPQYQTQVRSARAAAQIGLDITTIGLHLIPTARILAPHFRGPLLTSSTQPLVTQGMLDLLSQTLDGIMPLLNDIEGQTHQLSLASLPLSASQQSEARQLLQALPAIQSDLTQARELLAAAGWMLGVDAPRTFLVQTMDRAELRPTGGFTGQYGELTISAGRLAPFSLRDISFIEYTDNSPTLGQRAPAAYRSWWPFANWGLRDSNLSADFPTSAQIAIQAYQHEVGHHVDGVIVFTPFFIEHVLDVIGPLTVPGYNDTITAQNLEDRLHYYQQDNSGIRKQEIVQHIDAPTQARKLFTSRLAQTLMDRVRHAPPDELLAIARQALYDLKTRDIQVYVINPQVENLLMRYGFAAQMDRSTSHDGLYIVQANLNATKASQYVRTLIHDVVTLDDAGGATHNLQLRLSFTQTGPTYGYDAYRDYVRIYVPPSSKFISGDGFDTGTPLCGGPAPACNATAVYPHDELLCPRDQFQPGAASPSLSDENPGDWHPLDTIGPPTNMLSDEPGRAMFGGWVVVPKNCTMTVSLSWYVPPSVGGHYSLLVQRQAGTFPELDLTILPPDNCTHLGIEGLHVDTLMTLDALFTPRALPAGSSASTCYPSVTV
jgi:hypothetical protein